MTKAENLHTRVEPEVKEEAEQILSALGISVSHAINMFYRQIVLQRGIPFDMKLPGPEIPDLTKMSAAEIDNAQEQGWQDMLSGRTRPAGEVFAQMRREYGIE